MENITIGQITSIIVLIAGVVTSWKILIGEVEKKFKKALSPINSKIDNLELNSIKTDLVNFMCLAEQGTMTVEQKMNAHELYDRYCEKGGNSYVHDRWENLRKEGKI